MLPYLNTPISCFNTSIHALRVTFTTFFYSRVFFYIFVFMIAKAIARPKESSKEKDATNTKNYTFFLLH
jgi:hypothetical protein